MVPRSALIAPPTARGVPVTGGHTCAHAPVQLDVPPLSASNRYTVSFLLPKARTVPSLPTCLVVTSAAVGAFDDELLGADAGPGLVLLLEPQSAMTSAATIGVATAPILRMTPPIDSGSITPKDVPRARFIPTRKSHDPSSWSRDPRRRIRSFRLPRAPAANRAPRGRLNSRRGELGSPGSASPRPPRQARTRRIDRAGRSIHRSRSRVPLARAGARGLARSVPSVLLWRTG